MALVEFYECGDCLLAKGYANCLCSPPLFYEFEFDFQERAILILSSLLTFIVFLKIWKPGSKEESNLKAFTPHELLLARFTVDSDYSFESS